MKISRYINFLMTLPLFSGTDKKNIKDLLENKTITKEFARDQIIYMQNEKATTMDIILSGRLIVQNIDENGNILSIVSLTKGDMLGGNLIFSNNNEYPMTVTAQSKLELLSISKDMIIKLSQEDKVFLTNLLELFSDKALVLTGKIHSLARKTIREKIWDFLIFEANHQENKNIKLPISKKELADRFGVERPSLQRELKKMKDEGLIDYDSKTIRILGKEDLFKI